MYILFKSTSEQSEVMKAVQRVYFTSPKHYVSYEIRNKSLEFERVGSGCFLFKLKNHFTHQLYRDFKN